MQDLTFPFIAFQRGRRWSRVIEDFTGDGRIEDLWHPFFCVSANLNRAQMHVHRRGPLARALLATTRAPGVFPPVVIDGELHVDGGMANNVPVDVMRSFANGGFVMGVDVSPPHELNSVNDYGVDVNGFRALWNKFGPLRKSKAYMPSILLVLMRTIEYSGVAFKHVISRNADIYLSPPLLGFKRTDFHLCSEIAEVARQHCIEKTGEWLRTAERLPVISRGHSTSA
jgi:predicted acylesterase/phospholipase RssA